MGRPSKEYQVFTHAIDRLLSVQRATIVERLAAHRDQSAKNPRKRGPKPKVKSSGSVPDAG